MFKIDIVHSYSISKSYLKEVIIMQGKICCFFGHRDAPDTLADDLYTAAEEMVLLEGVTTFLVGGHGNFDFLAAQTVRQLRRVYPHIRLVLVAAYASALHSPRVREGGFDEAFVPDTLAKVPFKAAIVCRNRWMAEQTDFVIAYVIRGEGGAYTAVEYARKKGKKVCLI